MQKTILEKALELALSVDDKKNQGIIHAKIGRLQFTLSDYKKAIVSLTKAAELQRELNDKPNLATTYRHKRSTSC